MTSAHSASGSRDPALILPRLVVTKPSPAGAYILVDDVYTSGGHMRACEAKLRENGISVWAAIAAARTNDVEEQYPFSLVSVEVEGYEP
jgi:predicted amidophosphoribosyltransferase